MPYSLKDLTEVMEDRSAAGRPSPDPLPRVRRGIRRYRRRRAALGAAGTALAVAAAFGIVQQVGQSSGDRTPAAMTGVVNDAFTGSPPKEGMLPLREVRYSMVGRKARVQFRTTGPNTMITYRCPAQLRIYQVDHAGMAASTCSDSGGGAEYARTAPGAPVTFELVALPATVKQPSSPVELDRYLASHEPFPGSWSVQIYSGSCDTPTCIGPRPHPRQLPVHGLERLARATHAADGRPRTIAFSPSGKGVRLRLTCVDGAGVAVLREAGHAKIMNCEMAESRGIVWDVKARPDVRNELRITVLPAEAFPVTKTDDASLAKKMKGVEPAGTWTLEVYDR